MCVCVYRVALHGVQRQYVTFQQRLSHHSSGEPVYSFGPQRFSSALSVLALVRSQASALTCADTFVSLIQPQKANADTDLSVDISEGIKKKEKKKRESDSTRLRTGVIRVSAASVCTGFDCVMKEEGGGGRLRSRMTDNSAVGLFFQWRGKKSNIEVFVWGFFFVFFIFFYLLPI